MTARDERGRIKKGNSLNPNGRKIGSISLVNMLKKKLLEMPDGQKRTYAELLINRYMKNAIQDGDTKLITDLINRIDGMPTQRNETDLTSKGEKIEGNHIVFSNFKDGAESKRNI